MNQDDLEESEDFEILEDRIHRGPLLGVLLSAALIAGAVWVVVNVIIQFRLATGYSDLFSSEAGAELWAWAQAVSGIAYTTFLVALGSYVLLWLRVRQGSGSHP